jgi:hypothetical protein
VSSCTFQAQHRTRTDDPFLTMVVWSPVAQIQPADASGGNPALKLVSGLTSRAHASAELRPWAESCAVRVPSGPPAGDVRGRMRPAERRGSA